MNTAEFSEHLEKTISSLKQVLIRKRNDYATEDVLSNFKRNSKMAETLNIDMTKPEGYALFMVAMKLDRICNILFTEKQPKNESLSDSFIDLIGYTLLASAILEENS